MTAQMAIFNSSDNRRVALIKSLATNNRFYALVGPERGIQNADAIESIPDDLLLGIAYPCLEDGLNDFAVIRTTFETLDLFPDDDPIREEMMEIVNDARGNLLKRLAELHDKIHSFSAHFLGTDYNEFMTYALDIVNRGYPRRNLDSMMKLNVFSSVAEAEGHADAHDLLYFFEFSYANIHDLTGLPAREFIVELFQEVINSVRDDANYQSKYLFDKNVFQKFIAVMFVNYATTDPMFYGINRRDYGVSGDKNMDDTPLYMAINKELREIEQRIAEEHGVTKAAPLPLTMETHDAGSALHPPLNLAEGSLPGALAPGNMPEQVYSGESGFILPQELVNEEALMGTLSSLCSAACLLARKSDPETQRFARVILADASKLTQDLKRLGVVSSFVNDPGARGLDGDKEKDD